MSYGGQFEQKFPVAAREDPTSSAVKMVDNVRNPLSQITYLDDQSLASPYFTIQVSPVSYTDEIIASRTLAPITFQQMLPPDVAFVPSESYLSFAIQPLYTAGDPTTVPAEAEIPYFYKQEASGTQNNRVCHLWLPHAGAVFDKLILQHAGSSTLLTDDTQAVDLWSTIQLSGQNAEFYNLKTGECADLGAYVHTYHRGDAFVAAEANQAPAGGDENKHQSLLTRPFTTGAGMLPDAREAGNFFADMVHKKKFTVPLSILHPWFAQTSCHLPAWFALPWIGLKLNQFSQCFTQIRRYLAAGDRNWADGPAVPAGGVGDAACVGKPYCDYKILNLRLNLKAIRMTPSLTAAVKARYSSPEGIKLPFSILDNQNWQIPQETTSVHLQVQPKRSLHDVRAVVVFARNVSDLAGTPTACNKYYPSLGSNAVDPRTNLFTAYNGIKSMELSYRGERLCFDSSFGGEVGPYKMEPWRRLAQQCFSEVYNSLAESSFDGIVDVNRAFDAAGAYVASGEDPIKGKLFRDKYNSMFFFGFPLCKSAAAGSGLDLSIAPLDLNLTFGASHTNLQIDCFVLAGGSILWSASKTSVEL